LLLGLPGNLDEYLDGELKTLPTRDEDGDVINAGSETEWKWTQNTKRIKGA
jgi:hypothetical protein